MFCFNSPLQNEGSIKRLYTLSQALIRISHTNFKVTTRIYILYYRRRHKNKSIYFLYISTNSKLKLITSYIKQYLGTSYISLYSTLWHTNASEKIPHHINAYHHSYEHAIGSGSISWRAVYMLHEYYERENSRVNVYVNNDFVFISGQYVQGNISPHFSADPFHNSLFISLITQQEYEMISADNTRI